MKICQNTLFESLATKLNYLYSDYSRQKEF